MSSKAVTLEQLTIIPHPNADALELAQVGGYRAVVQKGRYQTGDWAIYIPEGVLLPGDLIKELDLEGRLAGKAENRVKAVRLRGELSQGIVCRPKQVEIEWEANNGGPEGPWCAPTEDELADGGLDFSSLLGIVPWEPPVPTQMAGQVQGAPRLVRWGDIENIKRFPDIFTPGEEVTATEKIHGTCFCATYVVETGEFMVTSKGLGAKNLSLKEEVDQNDQYRNIYWRMAREHNIEGMAYAVAEGIGTDVVISIAVFGEVYGYGIQDLQYMEAKPTLAIFDIKVVGKAPDGSIREIWLEHNILDELINHNLADNWKNETGLKVVPVLYEGPYDYDGLCAMAESNKSPMANGGNIMEGLVVRAVPERYSDVVGGRAIAKFINPDYLTRKGGTEYE